MTIRTLLHRGLATAAVLVAVGFGAAQAAAAPEAAAGAAACNAFQCNTQCIIAHYDYGICVDGNCECWYRPVGG